MLNDDGSYKSLDEMVIEEEKRKRREEARKKREAAERKQRQIDRDRADSTNFDNRTGAENSFYATPSNGGIIRAAQAPKFKSLDEYNDAIKAQDEMIDIMHQNRWDNASMHTKAEAADAKKLYDTAKEYKDNLEIAKADAIIERPHKYAQGTGGVSDYNKGMRMETWETE